MRVLCSVATVLLLLAACGKSSEKTPAPEATQAPAAKSCGPGLTLAADDAVVTVNGKPILCSELYARDQEVIDAITAKYEEKLNEIHALTLAELIDDRLMRASADEAKLSIEKFVAASISAVPATEENVKAFYEQAVARGEKLPAYEETKAEIAKFITERRQKLSLSKFRAQLRSQATIERHSKLPVPTTAPVAAPMQPAPAPAAPAPASPSPPP